MKTRWKESCGWMMVSCTTMWMYLIPLKCTLTMVKTVNFMLCVFTTIKKIEEKAEIRVYRNIWEAGLYFRINLMWVWIRSLSGESFISELYNWMGKVDILRFRKNRGRVDFLTGGRVTG